MPNNIWKTRNVNPTTDLKTRSKRFFRRQIDKMTGKIKTKSMDAMAWHTVNDVELGKMYFYVYDPKLKAKLPLYDKLPLVIPIGYYKDGFLGMNLHYLPPTARHAFLRELIKIGGNPNLNDTTKLKLNYTLLKSVAKDKHFKPTIHRYLYSHIRSQIQIIHPEEWDAVIFLPTARWAKGKPY